MNLNVKSFVALSYLRIIETIKFVDILFLSSFWMWKWILLAIQILFNITKINETKEGTTYDVCKWGKY